MEIRAHLGFRDCMVADAEELAGWLTGGCVQEKRRYELARDARVTEFRSPSIEPPTRDRVWSGWFRLGERADPDQDDGPSTYIR